MEHEERIERCRIRNTERLSDDHLLVTFQRFELICGQMCFLPSVEVCAAVETILPELAKRFK